MYEQSPTPFIWPRNHNLGDKVNMVISDFNCHNTIWDYSQTKNDGEAVELWALDRNLTLIT